MLFSSLLCACVAPGVLSASWIAPGAVWYDTDGNKIDAHGGGVVLRGDTYYWVGHASSNADDVLVHRPPELEEPWKAGKLRFRDVEAQDRETEWFFLCIFTPSSRIDVMECGWLTNSGQFIGGYGTSTKVRIPPDDYSYSDTGMFHDDATDTWYLLTSADHNIVQINRINSDGALGDKLSDLRAGAYEAPGIVKADGVYFLIVSGKTGWRANPNKVFWANSISGPWTGGSDIAPQDQNTYGSQNTFELTVQGSQKTTYIYMGDAWDSKGGADSNYVWLPMNINAGAKTIQLDYHAMWKVDVKTGAVSYPSTLKRYEANRSIISGRNVTFHNVTGTGSLQWLAFHYQINNPEAGEAYVIANDEPAVNISSLNSRAGYHDLTPIQLKLRSGDANTITFGFIGEDDNKIAVNALELFEED
ncbi:hypothetical protein CHU98_g3977 [Xylaria longipes]|nr:hypothetical protein CHU98_g3977 [Xylaria longipes]